MTQSTELERPVTEHRRPNGTFAPGNPGKPKGAKHRFNREVLERLGGPAERVRRMNDLRYHSIPQKIAPL